jgi:hypothetical protein
MGSSGSGSLSDYSGFNSSAKNQGAASGSDDCNKAFTAKLEEVDRCSFYITHSTLPAIETEVKLILNKRLTIITQSGESIGYLPTSLNFLAKCLADGISYQGRIINTREKPILSVEVDMAPI